MGILGTGETAWIPKIATPDGTECANKLNVDVIIQFIDSSCLSYIPNRRNIKCQPFMYLIQKYFIFLDNYSVIQNEQSHPKSRRIRRKETMNVGAIFYYQLSKSPFILRNNSIIQQRNSSWLNLKKLFHLENPWILVFLKATWLWTRRIRQFDATQRNYNKITTKNLYLSVKKIPRNIQRSNNVVTIDHKTNDKLEKQFLKQEVKFAWKNHHNSSKKFV